MKNEPANARKSISIRTIGWTLGGFGLTIVVLLVASLWMLSFQFNNVSKATEEYMALKIGALDVQSASDYLTDQARSFVVTGEDEYIFNYFEEGFTTNRREKALDNLKKKLGEDQSYRNLAAAVEQSKKLMDLEYYAMRLAINAFNLDYSLTNPKYQSKIEAIKHCEEIQKYVMPIVLKDEDSSLSIDEQKHKSIEYVYGDEYHEQKRIISNKIVASIAEIDDLLDNNVLNSSEHLKRVLMIQQFFIFLLVIFFVVAVIFIRYGLIKPIDVAVDKIVRREKLDDSHGLKEFKYLVNAYNEARDATLHNAEKLAYIAEHDKLTGIYNRAGYEAVYRNLDLEKTIYILIDIDNFKAINDKYGHIAGDKALKHISDVLCKHFPNDYVCRLGGDEFAILVFDYEENIRESLIKRFEQIEKETSSVENNLPDASVSIGVAFGTKGDDTDSLYRKADKAMYEVKNSNKNGYCFYDSIKEKQ